MFLASTGQLIGASFEDDGANWRVLEVGWDANVDEVVVWYYDLDSGLDPSVLMKNLDHDDVEHSSVSEVIAWITSSRSD
jgi:hypothetical protein